MDERDVKRIQAQPISSALNRCARALSATHLLQLRDVLRHVLDGARILDRESVALALQSRLVDEHASISRQTGEGQRNVRVDLHHLANGARLLNGRCTKERRDVQRGRGR